MMVAARTEGVPILIIEDEPDILELLRHNLEREKFSVLTAESGQAGIRLARRHRPALILLDLMLPDIQGGEVCRILKQRGETRTIPILMVTARTEEADVVLGLEIGADDYITKPFSIRELVARVRTVLRRARLAENRGGTELVHVGRVTIDPARHEVRVAGCPVNLTLSEFRLLRTLASRPGQVFTRAQLLDGMTPHAIDLVDRNVDVHVRALRRKLNQEKDLIVTVRGVGYKCRG